MCNRKIGLTKATGFIIYFALVLVFTGACLADVKLPAVISDNMVLQQGIKVPIWGWAKPGEKVSVGGFGIYSREWSTVADANGKWMVKIGPFKAGGLHDMTIKGNNTITLKNILVGEVWVCSGQSNMEFPVANMGNWKTGVFNCDKELADANYSKIRLFIVPMIASDKPQYDCGGKWMLCSPETVGNFSAVGYFFGRQLHKVLNVPIGLIDTSYGGTPAEAWTRKEILESDSDFKPILDDYAQLKKNYPETKKKYDQAVADWEKDVAKTKAEGKEPPQKPWEPTKPGSAGTPTVLYNAMISPLIPYSIAGAIWYQGEANASHAYNYRKLLPAMIKNWRTDWGQGDFPFLIVQLANYTPVQPEPGESDWAELREAQLMTLSTPNTGLAVTIDIGNAVDIHPRNKQDVAMRLALWALAKTYGQKDIVYSGPLYNSMNVVGNAIVLNFNNIGGGLVAKSNEPLKGFALAGEDHNFVWADANIVGDTVVVSSQKVSKPVAVRYAWANNPVCNLYNKEELPASPFRTDDWPGVTVPKK